MLVGALKFLAVKERTEVIRKIYAGGRPRQQGPRDRVDDVCVLMFGPYRNEVSLVRRIGGYPQDPSPVSHRITNAGNDRAELRNLLLSVLFHYRFIVSSEIVLKKHVITSSSHWTNVRHLLRINCDNYHPIT